MSRDPVLPLRPRSAAQILAVKRARLAYVNHRLSGRDVPINGPVLVRACDPTVTTRADFRRLVDSLADPG